MSINKDRVRLLIEALESGEFPQGNNYLTQIVDGVTQHCCLGVACITAQRNEAAVHDETTDDEPNVKYVKYSDKEKIYDRSYAYLPDIVVRWYGFPRNDPPLIGWDEEKERFFVSSATGLNDDSKQNFQQIAAAFRRTYIDHNGPDEAWASVSTS